jgi:hypothetical protein
MQSFDFGLDGTNRDETSLEQRINTLEIKLFDFEYAIAKLQGNNIPKPMLASRPYARGSIHGIFPDEDTIPTRTSPSTEGTSCLPSPATAHDVSFLSSPGESPLPSPDADDLFRPQRASRATTATIRPQTARRRSPQRSRSASPTSIHIPLDKFQALLEMVKEEKAARLRLEAEVLELQEEMESIRTPVYATIREAYPTPSPESAQSSSTAKSRTLHRTQGFQLSHASPEVSRFSGTDPDSEEEQGFENVYENPQRTMSTSDTVRGSPRQVPR